MDHHYQKDDEMTTDTKVRWRITLDELCHRCQCRPHNIDRWAELGAFGPRLQEKRERGWHSHITRQTAQRAVIMQELLSAGLQPAVAAAAAAKHETNDTGKLTFVSARGVTVTVDRAKLDLP